MTVIRISFEAERAMLFLCPAADIIIFLKVIPPLTAGSPMRTLIKEEPEMNRRKCGLSNEKLADRCCGEFFSNRL
jgi:hypothetical protein